MMSYQVSNRAGETFCFRLTGGLFAYVNVKRYQIVSVDVEVFLSQTGRRRPHASVYDKKKTLSRQNRQSRGNATVTGTDIGSTVRCAKND